MFYRSSFVLNLTIFFLIVLPSNQILWSRVSDPPTNEGSGLIGKKALGWTVGDWINSEPLGISDLKGKVVLVRFWTGPECPYCKASAPALDEFYEKYHIQGLEVIGIYHHKSAAPLNKTRVQKLVQEYQFKFPIAIDYDWKTLRQWWLDADDRRWTSVSFLIDRKGVIRYIHPGGQYIKGDKDYTLIETKIAELLKEDSNFF